jgi:hypothetical protein
MRKKENIFLQNTKCLDYQKLSIIQGFIFFENIRIFYLLHFFLSKYILNLGLKNTI